MTVPIENLADAIIADDVVDGRPGKGVPPVVSEGGTPVWLWLLVAIVMVAILTAGGIVLFSGGTTTTSRLPTGTPTSGAVIPSTSSSIPTPPSTGAAPPSSTPRPLLTGTYSGTIAVAPGGDPAGHDQYIGPMPTTLDVRATRNTATEIITIDISGSPPFIAVVSTGNYNTATGTFDATGSGLVTTRNIPVSAELSGTLLGGSLSGTLMFTGTPDAPISYRVQMTKSA